MTPNSKRVQNSANPTTKAEGRWGQLSPTVPVWFWKSLTMNQEMKKLMQGMEAALQAEGETEYHMYQLHQTL